MLSAKVGGLRLLGFGLALLGFGVAVATLFSCIQTSGPIDQTARRRAIANHFDLAVLMTVAVRISNPDGICREGSGVLVGHGLYVLTNAHVATGNNDGPPYIGIAPLDPSCKQISVGILNTTEMTPTTWFPANVVQSRPTLDLALLRLEGVEPGKLPSADIDMSDMQIGDEIFLVGFPDYGSGSVVLTNGIVAGTHEADYGHFYMATAAISGGNSGGPAVSVHGKLVGVSTLGAPVRLLCQPDEDFDKLCYLNRSQIAFVRPIAFAQPLFNIMEMDLLARDLP